MYLIESGIKPKEKIWSVKKFPFDEMKIGDSFFYSGDNVSLLRNSASVFGSKNNMKFSVHKERNEAGKYGARCYRTK